MHVSPAAVAEVTPASVSSNATTRAGSRRSPPSSRSACRYPSGSGLPWTTSSAEITSREYPCQPGGGQNRLDLSGSRAGHDCQRHLVGRQPNGRAHVGRDSGAVVHAGLIRRHPLGDQLGQIVAVTHPARDDRLVAEAR